MAFVLETKSKQVILFAKVCGLHALRNAIYLRNRRKAKTCHAVASLIDAENDQLLLEEVHVSIEEKVIDIVSEQLSVPKEEVSRQSSFVDDLKADSLDVVEIVMEFEDEFEITIPDDDYEKIRTVGDAIDYIEEKS